MIVLLKMHASGKIFDKICLKSVRDTFFFQYLVCDQGQGDSIPSVTGTTWSPRKENPEKGAWSTYRNDFEKSEWEYFLSNQ